jgi:hypothetical protein
MFSRPVGPVGRGGAGFAITRSILTVMVINVQIPKPLLDAVDRKAHALKMDRDDLIVQALEKELAPESDWSPEFFEKLSPRGMFEVRSRYECCIRPHISPLKGP